MAYETSLVNQSVESLTITMNRPEHRNSLNNTMLKEINEILDLAGKNPHCRIVAAIVQIEHFHHQGNETIGRENVVRHR
jgi:enoyl-CoA hydratase/carnithine racemase